MNINYMPKRTKKDVLDFCDKCYVSHMRREGVCVEDLGVGASDLVICTRNFFDGMYLYWSRVPYCCDYALEKSMMMEEIRTEYVYALYLSDGSSYISITDDIPKALQAHNQGRIRRTKKHLPVSLEASCGPFEIKEARKIVSILSSIKYDIQKIHIMRTENWTDRLEYHARKGRG
jgi:predicted GIY-YIG superfamily endonuclease